MTVFYLEPKNVICDFLRRRLEDPRSRAEATNTETITATDNKKNNFTLTPPSGKTACITSLSVNGTDKTKYTHYYWDDHLQKIIFFTDLNRDDEIIVTYKYGSTNWIQPDKPLDKLSATSFPRINVLVVSGSGIRLGNYEAPVYTSLHFQIDVWTKERQNDQIFTIDGRKYAGDKLAGYLAYLITEAFETYESDMFPLLDNYVPVRSPSDLPFNTELQCHHKVAECIMKCLKVGRIEY